MLHFAADGNLNHHLIRGLLRRNPALDIVTAQDAGLSGATDSEILEWSAREGRVLLTHDVTTLSHHAYERVRRATPMPGVIQVSLRVSPSDTIEDILLRCERGHDAEFENRIIHLPLR